MDCRLWRQRGPAFELQLPRLRATIDSSAPAAGLRDLCVDGALLPGVQLFSLLSGVQYSLGEGRAVEWLASPDECYARGPDLIAVYRSSPGRRVHLHVLWRGSAPGPSEPWAGCVDLIVSVRTELLSARPELPVLSHLPPGEVLRLTDARCGQFCAVAASGAGTCDVQPEDGPGCLLFRWPQSAFSYVEMVHPDDFRGDRLQVAVAAAPGLDVCHYLFAREFEKGVLLRARVRGAFVPRADDCRAAAACYAAFAAAEPPLGT